jgi:acyl-coenzyme A synthetase/AMP-(fatty) acid ligase
MNMTDYEETKRSFRLEVPDRFNFAGDVVDRWAGDRTKLALLSVDQGGGNPRHHTFYDLSLLSIRMANALEAMGVAKGDRVFLMLPRIPEWYVALLGCIRLGAVAMPATVLCTARDIDYRCNAAEASVAICDSDAAARVDEVAGNIPTLRTKIVVGEAPGDGWKRLDALLDAASPRRPAPDTAATDPMLLYFTSGTVAYPKMVQHTQASYGIGHIVTARFWLDLTPTDLHWTISDTGWAKAAWGKLFGQWQLGATVFQHNAVGKFDPELALSMIARYGITTFCAPPTAYRGFAQLNLHQFDFSSLRHSVAAGEPLNPEVIRVWKEATGQTILDGYGQTETCNIVANYPCLDVRPGSMGKPTPGWDVDVVDDEGTVLPDGEEGHIAVRVSPERPVGLFTGYWRDDEATARAFSGDWYYTGDRAIRDDDGYLWFVGRSDDVIISASYRIGPFEVESALVEHPAVAEAAVVGKADPQRTQIVKAYVILAAGYEGSPNLVTELQDHVKAVTAPYKYPREIEFVHELPKTISGKIRRVELRERSKEDA